MSGRPFAPAPGDDEPMSGCAPFLAALVARVVLIAGIAHTLR